MSVTCAWCRSVIVAGVPPVSHGLCSSCEPRVLAEVDLTASRRPREATPRT